MPARGLRLRDVGAAWVLQRLAASLSPRATGRIATPVQGLGFCNSFPLTQRCKSILHCNACAGAWFLQLALLSSATALLLALQRLCRGLVSATAHNPATAAVGR